ncbi:hypothetical protein ISG33_07390 [Glaciecola sp. MH2013]|uniref:hypothetical protein n=1 Tax=Glaciecola sp. MH2013 TaxID=2785524 RepID=UPI00189EC925|nr:hypothetical protein [Glaciecola sp. MH2013]MBF7073218.1 hypothetical protein [Glaciecola sp. MH2013]
MLRKIIVLAALLLSFQCVAIDLDIKSLRVTLSKPSTSHVLIHNSALGDESNIKSAFNIRPLNNERLGFFLDVNGIEIGYASDVFADDVETKTQNFLFSYRKWQHSKITLNIQSLENLHTNVRNLSSGEGLADSVFKNTKSTKIELFGLHNLYTFHDKESVFEHFFLNQPLLSSQFDWSIGVVAGWSLKSLKLENPDSIVFTPDFLDSDIETTTKLRSRSVNVDVGPFLSLNLPNNINMFAEYKIGRGYINNKQVSEQLKQSGDEKASAFGAGISYTSQDKKLLVLLRGWKQKGRHVSTSFGDLSVVRYF